MIEWLDGFDGSAGLLEARLLTANGVECVRDLGSLRDRGAPPPSPRVRRGFAVNFEDWHQVPTERYLSAFHVAGELGGAHTVFSFRFGRYEYLVPALVLLRGLFPLIPAALRYAFTPRPLEALCVPLTRAGQWTVGMPDFTGLYAARFRRPTLEALTWASLYPSARWTWRSVFLAAQGGRMSLELPKATAQVVPYGIRVNETVHVTALGVSAVLAEESPFHFAEGASRSFLFCTKSEPLAPSPNAYYETHEVSTAAQFKLTDDEWAMFESSCAKHSASPGRRPRDRARDVADALLIRAATALPWHEIPVPIAGNAQARHSKVWRQDGRLRSLFMALQGARVGAAYLECAAL